MYRYDSIDHEMLADRVAEFRGQCERRLAGELSEDQFKPLRLKNGLYLQLHAYMLRIAIPRRLAQRTAPYLGARGPHLRSWLRSFHDTHQPSASLD